MPQHGDGQGDPARPHVRPRPRTPIRPALASRPQPCFDLTAALSLLSTARTRRRDCCVALWGTAGFGVLRDG